MDGKKLPEEVAKKYEVLKGHGVGEYHWNGHVVKLDVITAADADKLVKKGFPYLVAKSQVAAAPVADKKA